MFVELPERDLFHCAKLGFGISTKVEFLVYSVFVGN